jgi:hypothetical protein
MEIFNMIKFALTSDAWYFRTLDSSNTIAIYLMENSKSTRESLIVGSDEIFRRIDPIRITDLIDPDRDRLSLS